MKKQLLLGLVLLLLLPNMVFGAVGDAVSGYDLETDGSDVCGTNDLTDFNTVDFSGTGIIGGDASFTSANSEYLQDSAFHTISNSDTFSLSFWMNTDDTSNNKYKFALGGEATNDFLARGFFFSNVFYVDYQQQGTGAFIQTSYGSINAGMDYHIVLIYNGSSGTANLYVNGTLVSTATGTPAGNNASSLVLGAGNENGVTGYSDMDIDEVYFYTENASSYVSTLYNGGAGYQPCAGPTPSDEIFAQNIQLNQTLPVTINSQNYVDIYSSTFSVANNTSAYMSWTVETESINRDTVVTCDYEINGTTYDAEKNRTLLTGETAFLYLFGNEINIESNKEYVATLICKRNATGGAKVTVRKANGVVNLMSTADGDSINHEHYNATFNLTSSSYTYLGSQLFNTSNITVGDFTLNLVADGAIRYTYDSDATISIYAQLNGVNSSITEREDVAGALGSGGGIMIFENVSANSTLNISYYGKSNSSDGSIFVKNVLKEFLLHDEEVKHLDMGVDTALTKSASWVTIETLYVNNSNHINSDIKAKVSLSAYDSSGSNNCYAGFRIKGDDYISQEYNRTLTDKKKAMVIQHIIENQGLSNTSVELQTINNCTAGNTPLYSGGFMAYIADETTATPNFYKVNASDYWDNSSITTFNVTTSDGTLYQSNANGDIFIFSVNGLENLTASATGYFNYTVLNHNSTNNLTIYMNQSDIKFLGLELITNNTISGNITIDGVLQATNTSFYLKAGTYNVTFSSVGYFNKTQEFTISALDVTTLYVENVSDAELKVNATNAQTGAVETTFNMSIYGPNGFTDFKTTTNGSLYFYVKDGYNYTVFVNDSDHAVSNETILVDDTYENLTMIISTINSVLITIYDEFTEQIINDTNMTVEFISDSESRNVTTGNGSMYVDLLSPDSYELRYFSTDNDNYPLRSYFFTLTNNSFTQISLYALSTNETTYDTVTVNFEVLDRNLQPVEGALVSVSRYYIEENGYSQVLARLTNTNGIAQGIFEQQDAFYLYTVSYNGVTRYTSPSTGTQFNQDQTITIYIDTTTTAIDSINEILYDLSGRVYFSPTPYINGSTGYFIVNIESNPEIIQYCLDITPIYNATNFTCGTSSCTSTTQEICSNTASGTITATVSHLNTSETVTYDGILKAYNPTTDSYIVMDTYSLTFIGTNAINSDAGLKFIGTFFTIIILIAIALAGINFPAGAMIAQSIVFIVVSFWFTPFIYITWTTAGWVLSLLVSGAIIISRSRSG